jgi:hypothetical protein
MFAALEGAEWPGHRRSASTERVMIHPVAIPSPDNGDGSDRLGTGAFAAHVVPHLADACEQGRDVRVGSHVCDQVAGRVVRDAGSAEPIFGPVFHGFPF